MKLNKIILISVLSLSLSPVLAYDITEETTTPEYLINHGFSNVTSEQVQLTKAQSANREYKSGRYSKIPWWRKFWNNYFDIGSDDGTLLQHDIKPYSSYTDW